MNTKRILVVDDEESICEILKFNLQKEGYLVDTALSGEHTLQLDTSVYDLFILDVMMGEMSGYTLASHLKERSNTANKPIIFCTALNSEYDTVTGLNLGADDFISKPFSIKEVMARVRSVLRRTYPEMSAPAEIIKHLGLTINKSKKKIEVDGKEITLTKKEFEILDLLLSQPGKIFSRADILSRIWTEEVIVLDRTIDVNITRLRKKIEPYGTHIVTRQGFGYGFDY